MNEQQTQPASPTPFPGIMQMIGRVLSAVAGFIRNDTPIPDTPLQAKIRALMGPNFFGLEEVRQCWGIRLNPNRYPEIPFPEELIIRLRETHVLLPGVPLSLDKMMRYPGCFILDNLQPSTHPLYTETVEPRWYLMRRDAVPGSGDTYPWKQHLLLSECETIPRVCEEAYKVFSIFLRTGDRLHQESYVSCTRTEDFKDIVVLGRFKEHIGLIVDWRSFHEKEPYIGLASMIRHPGLS